MPQRKIPAVFVILVCFASATLGQSQPAQKKPPDPCAAKERAALAKGYYEGWKAADPRGEFERGERNVALVNVEKIAGALKVSLSELFRGV